MLSLIQFPLSHSFFFTPLYLHIPLVMWNELRRDPISFLYVICDCGAVCLSRKQFHKKLSAFIQFSEEKVPAVMMLYFCVIASMFVVACAYTWGLFSCTCLFVQICLCNSLYNMLSVIIVLSETLKQRFSDLLFLLTCCEAVTCLQHLISSLWSLWYQMNVSEQHPCSPLFLTVLACIWYHVGGMSSAFTAVFFKRGLRRENQSRETRGSSFSCTCRVDI